MSRSLSPSQSLRHSLAGLLLLVLVAASCLVLCLPGSSYARQERDTIMAPASAQHWTGTDALGRDRTARTAGALLLGLAGAAAAAAATTAIATAAGTLAGFSPPALRAAILLFMDVFLCLPWLFLLMMVRSGLPLTTTSLQSALITFAVLAALGWPACARAVHRGTLAVRASACMVHGRASGLRPAQLIRLHVLPQLRPLILTQFLLCVPAFIVAEANLGTLGLGIAEPLPSWGAMLLELEHSALLVNSAWVYLPIAILCLVLLSLESLFTEES